MATDNTIAPIPQSAILDADTMPLGAIALDVAADVDSHALKVLREGLEEHGLPAPATGSVVGPHTVIRLRQDTATAEACVEACAGKLGSECTMERLGTEGYLLSVAAGDSGPEATIASVGGAGMAYGVDTLLQLIDSATGTATIRSALVFDYPAVAIRIYGGTKTLERAARMRYNVARRGGDTDELAEQRALHVEPWASCHPSHAAAMKPGLKYSDPEAVEEAIAPLVEAAANGVDYLSMNFDDIDLKLGHPEDVERFGTIGKAHVHFINTTLARLRQVNPNACLIVIPIIYANNWMPGTWVYATDEDEIYDYLTALGDDVDPSVEYIWTGESVESMCMTDDDIKQWVDLVKRPPIIFENTPTGFPTDYGALKMRTPNVGELLRGWIYIHRGPQAEIAELTTAEYLWNPKAYDHASAEERAITSLVGDEAAPAMAKLIGVFKSDDNAPRYQHQTWREGRILEVVDPDDSELAACYRSRLKAIEEALPELDRMVPEVELYQAIRALAVGAVEVMQAYVEAYTMIDAAGRGSIADAIEAGDRTEALLERWRRYSTGTTDLHGETERRDAIGYLKDINAAGRLRAIRRGGSEPIEWIAPTPTAKRHGRECAVLNGDSLELTLPAGGSTQWLAITGSGTADVSVAVDGSELAMPPGCWNGDGWTTVAVPLSGTGAERKLTVSGNGAADWALARAAVLRDPEPARVLHAARSSVEAGGSELLTTPTRHVVSVTAPGVHGRVAVRTDIEVTRGTSARWFELDSIARVGQTFRLPPEGEFTPPVKDYAELYARESLDGGFLHGVAVTFVRQGTGPLRMSLHRWAGSVDDTLGDAGNSIAEAIGRNGTPYGPSRHQVGFEFNVELDHDATYYVEIAAPDGWDGWRLRRAFGWYGHRSDPTRSAYVDGAIESGVDIPFRTYVCDVYDAEWA